MLKHHLKAGFRIFIRNKNHTIINITGMTVGIAVCLMIFIVVQFHTSFDSFHPDKDRIYRVLTEHHEVSTGNISYSKDVPFPLPGGLKTAFPALEQVTMIWASQNDQLLIPDGDGKPLKTFKEQRGVFFTDPAFFQMFNFPLLAGSYVSLKDPDNVLLTKEVAERYFGDWRSAMGKTIILEVGGHIFEHGSDKLKVSGILATMPANTDFQLKVVVAFGTGITGFLSKSDNWNDATTLDFGCYLMLPGKSSANHFTQQLRTYSARMRSAENKDSHVIQALTDVHYDIETGNYSNKTISPKLVNVLWLIAAFILLIACVNFINLSTAQAVYRAKEVGVRKVLGSNNNQLQLQFILETFLIVSTAVILATALSLLAIPLLNQLLELSVPAKRLSDPAIIIFLFTVTIIVTTLAGLYPSVALSRFNAIDALKSTTKANPAKGFSLRKALVVFQFVIAQALIIGTIIIIKQMNHFLDRPLGFNKDAVINVPFRIDSLRGSRLESLKNRLLSINGVEGVSFNSSTPMENDNDLWNAFRFDHAIKETEFKAITRFADEGYLDTYKLPLVAGRNLRPSKMTREFLVNESLMMRLGINDPEQMLNKEISMWNDLITCKVVGVLKDFNDRSFHHKLAPLLITTNGTMYNQAAIKIATTNTATTLSSVERIFKKTFPNFVYEYRFLDEKIQGFYKQEKQLSQLYKIFAAIAISLSCLGLYGLSCFIAAKRIKEVGIRKVLGASASGIVYLFSKQFIILIGIAFLIAAPLAWLLMHQWLQSYVYRISISWWNFAAGGMAAMIIALATISFQAIKAAVSNPVKNLRSE
jgi:putative ABC transport system permease protein